MLPFTKWTYISGNFSRTLGARQIAYENDMSALVISLEGNTIEVVQVLASIVIFIAGQIIPLILESISIIKWLSPCAAL